MCVHVFTSKHVNMSMFICVNECKNVLLCVTECMCVHVGVTVCRCTFMCKWE